MGQQSHELGGPIVELPDDGHGSHQHSNTDRPHIEELGSALEDRLKSEDFAMFRGISFLSDSPSERPQVEVESGNNGGFQVLSPTSRDRKRAEDVTISKPPSGRSANTLSPNAKHLSPSKAEAEAKPVDPNSDSYQNFLASSLLARNSNAATKGSNTSISGSGGLSRQPTLGPSISANFMDDASVGLNRGNSLDYWGIRNVPIDQVDFTQAIIGGENADASSSSNASNNNGKKAGNVSGAKRASSASTGAASSGNVEKKHKRNADADEPATRIQPEEYMGLLAKKQEVRKEFCFSLKFRDIVLFWQATLCRIDSLQQALEMLTDHNGEPINADGTAVSSRGATA
jgi:hypothetical protein